MFVKFILLSLLVNLRINNSLLNQFNIKNPIVSLKCNDKYSFTKQNSMNDDDFIQNLLKKYEKQNNDNKFINKNIQPIGIFVNGKLLHNQEILKKFFENDNDIENSNNKNNNNEYNDDNDDNDDNFNIKRRRSVKSKNFEVIYNYPLKFNDIGGYDNIKKELKQCVDMLTNYKKYAKYNVRLPKGIILEGPPGNGKTLLVKGLAGEFNVGFIAVSGSEFEEKYVGVGPARMREMFELAKKNKPCIIFIDEIDALGRSRSGDGEGSSAERDSTLNELLVGLDGFKDTNGIFLICATNRVDLLDSALIRPGRIDKKIFIGPPDSKTRSAIINIHIKGKPYEGNVDIDKLVENTNGLSGAQIENILNEAMLNALRDNRFFMNSQDIELIINRVISGWQSSEHEYTEDIIRCIAIHEMGHAIVGMFCKHHSKLKKIVINLQSPNTPAYTIFETSTTNIQTKQQLLEQLMILLSGRIAEELFFGKSITTGAINDFDEATKLAQKMIVYYGMGNKIIYPNSSDKYKEMIDTEIFTLINDAHQRATFIIKNTKELILESSFILMKEKTLNLTDINALIAERYPNILNINI